MPEVNPADMLAVCILLLLGVPVVYFELRDRRIPNPITYFGIVAGLLMLLFWRRSEMMHYILAFVAGFGLFYIFFLLGWVGGGDVKLVGMIGILMGGSFLTEALIYTTLAGGLIALGTIIYRLIKRLPLRGVTIPYGTAIVAGSYTVLLEKIL